MITFCSVKYSLLFYTERIRTCKMSAGVGLSFIQMFSNLILWSDNLHITRQDPLTTAPLDMIFYIILLMIILVLFLAWDIHIMIMEIFQLVDVMTSYSYAQKQACQRVGLHDTRMCDERVSHPFIFCDRLAQYQHWPPGTFNNHWRIVCNSFYNIL